MAQITDRWYRSCPNCGTAFSSVQEWGVCPHCLHRFAVDRSGTILVDISKPVERHGNLVIAIAEKINELVAALPDSVIQRVKAEFADSKQETALRMLAAYGERPHENWGERVWNKILDRAHGDICVVESLVLVAKADDRNLFYSSRNDPYFHVGKLLKHLRFKGVLTDKEVAEAKRQGSGTDADGVFRAVCRMIGENKQITADQHRRICLIGERLRYPPHSLDWLKGHVVDSS